MTRSPSFTPDSAIILVLSNPSNVTTSTATTYSAIPGGMYVWVLHVVSFITVPISIHLSFVGYPDAASAELPLPFWVEVGSAISDKFDEILPYLSLKRRM